MKKVFIVLQTFPVNHTHTSHAEQNKNNFGNLKIHFNNLWFKEKLKIQKYLELHNKKI